MPWSGAAMLLGRATALIGDVERSERLAALLAPHAGLMTWAGSITVGPLDLALAELAVTRNDLESARRYAASARRLVDRLHAVVYEPDLERLDRLVGDRAS